MQPGRVAEGGKGGRGDRHRYPGFDQTPARERLHEGKDYPGRGRGYPVRRPEPGEPCGQGELPRSHHLRRGGREETGGLDRLRREG